MFGADYKAIAFTDINSRIKFVDTTFEDSGSRDHFLAGTVTYHNNGTSIENRMLVELAWTTDLTIQGDGSPLANTEVGFYTLGEDDPQILTTDGSGKVAPILAEWSLTGASKTSLNPHAVVVDGYEEGSVSVDEAGETATINLTSE